MTTVSGLSGGEGLEGVFVALAAIDTDYNE